MNKKKITDIPPIEVNDSYISCFQTKAELFNDYFSSLCSLPNDDNIVPLVPQITNNKLTNFTADVESIVSIINKLKTKKASGPDGISAHMLKLCPVEMASALYHLFNKILITDEFPDVWKMANVQPVHKKSSRQQIKNYRPISLLPICSKIFEKITLIKCTVSLSKMA